MIARNYFPPQKPAFSNGYADLRPLGFVRRFHSSWRANEPIARARSFSAPSRQGMMSASVARPRRARYRRRADSNSSGTPSSSTTTRSQSLSSRASPRARLPTRITRRGSNTSTTWLRRGLGNQIAGADDGALRKEVRARGERCRRRAPIPSLISAASRAFIVRPRPAHRCSRNRRARDFHSKAVEKGALKGTFSARSRCPCTTKG